MQGALAVMPASDLGQPLGAVGQGDRLRRGWIPARALLCLMGDLERARLAMADEGSKRSLIEHFSALDDPRQAWKVIYPLPEIMLLVLCATLAGAEDFVEARLLGC